MTAVSRFWLGINPKRLKRFSRKAFWLKHKPLVVLSLVVLACALTGLNIYSHRQDYKLSPAELKLLSASSIEPSSVKLNKGNLSYNQADSSGKGSQKITVASATDSTGKEAYRVTLASKASSGIEFSDSASDLPFKLIPQDSLGSGKYVDGRYIYPSPGGKSIYTLKRNGIKEDIILTQAPGDTLTYSWKLELGSQLAAKLMPDGSVGIYSADPLLSGSNLQIGDAKSQALIDNARKNGAKDSLQYLIPKPYIKDVNGKLNAVDVKFTLRDNLLTLIATNLQNKSYPLSIDPTVVTTTTAQFGVGYYDTGNIDYSTADEIDRGNISLGSSGAFTTNTNRLTSTRFGNAAVAYNGYVYNVGGFGATDATCGNSSCADVQYALIGVGGSLGTFTKTHSFTNARQHLGAVAYNGYLYVIGGFDSAGNCGSSPAGSMCNDVQYALICTGSNSGVGGCGATPGTLGTFVTSANTLVSPRSELGVAVYNGYLYVVGGLASSTNSSCFNTGSNNDCYDVQYAPINANGSIGAFATNATHFTGAREAPSAAAYNGRLYIIGGLDTVDATCNGAADTACSDVQYASINADGSVGAFTTNANRFVGGGRQGMAVAISAGYLYVAGGSSNTSPCNGGTSGLYCTDVQYASINANGSIGTFTTNTNRFTSGRFRLGGAIYNGYLYIVGGEDVNDPACNGTTGNFCDDVQYSQITAGTPTFGTDGTWNYTSNSTNNGATFSAGFTTARENQATVAYNGYLYVLGGDIGNSVNDCTTGSSTFWCNGVQYAPINADGTVGAWHYTHAGTDDGTTFSAGFTNPRTSLTSAAYNGYLYIIGGQGSSAANDCNTGLAHYCNGVQYAPINADGTVGAWHYTHAGTDDGTTFSAGFTTARASHTTVAYNGYLYVIGGSQSIGAGSDCSGSIIFYCNGVQYAPINADGTVGAWHYTHAGTDDGTTFSAGFTQVRADHTTVAYNGYLYVIGGHMTGSANDCASNACNGVQFAPINSNGTIGAWHYTHASTDDNTTFVAGFTQPRYGHTTVAYNGYLYVMGGISGSSANDCTATSNYCNGVQFAPINSNGTIGAWHYTHAGTDDGTTFSTGFASARFGHTTVAYNGYLYVLGGLGSTSANDCASGFLYCNGVQFTSMNSPEQAGTYEKVIDLGSSAAITNIAFNGKAVCGMSISYRVGDSSGVYGSITTITYGLPATTYSINQTGRYLWVQFKMNDATCGTRSQITDFTVTYNVVPAAPTLSAPSNGATGVTNLQFQLSTTDADNDYLRYKIDLCSTSNCSSIVTTIDQTSSQAGWTGQDQQGSTAYTGSSTLGSSTMATYNYTGALNKNTQYWWRGYAIDPGGSNAFSTVSGIRTFTTGDSPPAPPTLLYPINSSNGSTVFTTFQLRSTEINGDYLEYWIDVCSISNCSSIIRSICQTNSGTGVPGTCIPSQTGWAGQDQQAGTAYSGSPILSQIATHNYQAPYLTKNTQFWWRAYAIDPGGSNTWSSASSIATFTTAPTETHIQGNVNIKGGVHFGN